MDVKDSRTDSALSERNNDGSKYTQSGVALQCNRNKSYQDIGSNPLAKTEPVPVRPCAVIGPDRVVPPPSSNDIFLKKGSVEPWPSPDHGYRRPPEYPHKLSNLNPSRNISPRQTFQENMQRIMVPPTYSAVRHSDDANFNHIQDRNMSISKNVKPNMAPEAKFCEVPYAISSLANEPKNIRDADMYVPSVTSPLTRTAPHGWPPASVNVHAPRTYGAHELYQYPQYPSCSGQRPAVPMTRPHRTIQEDPVYVYPEHYYQDSSARFKAFPPVKERYAQSRYEYVSSTNYPSPFHPPPPTQPHKYDIPKPTQAHPYPMYPHLKYLENRAPPDHTTEGYPRPTNTQPHYNIQFRNQVIQSTYAPMPGNNSQSKVHHPYPLDGTIKSVVSNKLPYDNNNKMYVDYENSRTKTYPIADNYFVNEMGRVHGKNQMLIPNYPSMGMHSIPPQQYYRKDSPQMKPFEYMPHFRNFEPHMNNNAVLRHAPQFSPSTLAISPTDSNASNDMSQTHGISQEDCGYVSQSSTASVRSVDSGMYRLPNEYYNKRYDFRYGPIVGSPHTLSKSDLISNSVNSKDKQKQIDVRQFLQMWNEGEEENCENNNSKEIVVQTGSSDSNISKQHGSHQDQLYVLGLVNVPSEELSKYEHIQKISKLPENIKGYNSLELLSQFEEAIESSHTNNFKSIQREYQMSPKFKTPKQGLENLPRPVSPLDVESKISQSVIHKEVGCNFEIRPCSPKMLNVEVPAPAQNILSERVIEKVTNPLSKVLKSPTPMKPDENTITRQENAFTMNKNPSCKMIKSPYATSNMDSVKTNYSMQDLEINSGVCLASLPRLDNEIELNFPEVNQQFINANKKGTATSTTRNCSKSTNMEQQAGLTDHSFLNTVEEHGDNALIAEDSEKTFTKLSKYRKLKANTVDSLETNQLTMAVRTDSVIIKNPENIKNIEDKLLENSLNVPMNLSSQSSECHVPNLDSQDKLSAEKINNDEIALDFSLNKAENGLPIIDIEKDELQKTFETIQPNTSCENILVADSTESYSTSYSDTAILNSKESTLKCIDVESNTITLIDNNIEAKRSPQINLDGDTTESVTVDDYQTTILDDTCSDRMPANKEHSRKSNHDANIKNNDKELLPECQKTRQVINGANLEKITHEESYDTHDNITVENNLPQNYENCSNILSPLKEIASTCEETTDIMQLMNSSNKSQVTDVKSELVIPSKNENDFENDEISAKLEKIFQDSSEDTTPPDCGFMDVDVTMSAKSLCYPQRKELYSPWIQKLLIHTEGICSNNANDVTETESLHSILKNDEYKLKHSDTQNVLEEIQFQKLDGDQHTNIVSNSLHNTTSNKLYFNKTIEILPCNDDSNTEPECNLLADSANTVCNLDVCFDKNEKDLENVIVDKLNVEVEDSHTIHHPEKQEQNEQELIKLEVQTIDNDQHCDLEVRIKTTDKLLCSTNELTMNEIDIKSRKSDSNMCTLNTSESESKLSNCDTDGLSNVESRLENQTALTYSKTEDNETYSSSRRVHEHENIIQKDLANLNIKKAVNYISEEHEIGKCVIEKCEVSEKKHSEDTFIENAFTNHHSKDTNEISEKSLSGGTMMKNVTLLHNMEKDESFKENQIKHLIENETNCNSEIETLEEDHSSLSENAIMCCNSSADKAFEEKQDVWVMDEYLMNTDRHVEIGEAPENCHNKDALIENDMVNQHSDTERKRSEILDKDDAYENNRELYFCGNSIANHDTVEVSKANQISEIVSGIVIDSNTSEVAAKNVEPVKENVIDKHYNSDNKRKDDDSESVITNQNVRKDEESDTCEAVEDRIEQNFCGSLTTNNYTIRNLKSSESCDIDIVNILEVNKDTAKRLSEKETNNYDFDSSTVSKENVIVQDTDKKLTAMDEASDDSHLEECAIENELTNRSIDSYQTSEISHHNKVSMADGNVDNSSFKSLTDSFSDNSIGQKTEEHQEHFSATETDRNVCVASKICDRNEDNLIPLNESNPILHNVAYCESDRWTERQTDSGRSLCDSDIPTDNKVQLLLENCETNTYSLNHQNHPIKKAFNSDTPENYIQNSPVSGRRTLKRSFSDSALNTFKNRDNTNRQETDNSSLIWPCKRQRMFEMETPEQHVINESLCSIIQNNRRNSVSTFYNEENVSFCILIDNNCIISEENEEEKICFAEISEDCIAEINTTNEEDDISEVICCSQENEIELAESVVLDYDSEKTIQESWLDDVACVETVVSDDIVEDVIISAQTSPEDIEGPSYDESAFSNFDISEEYTDEDKLMNEEIIQNNITQIVAAYPDTDVNEISITAPEDTDLSGCRYRDENLEKNISRSHSPECSPSPKLEYAKSIFLPSDNVNQDIPEDKENFENNPILTHYENDYDLYNLNIGNDENNVLQDNNQSTNSCSTTHNGVVKSRESSIDTIFGYKEHDDVPNKKSSSPEVSSTTSEEKSSCILLKITNHNGSRVSEVNEVSHNRPRCKFTENKDYSNSYGTFPKRPLLTKAAQKYIPPLKESIGDLKVKLTLPQQKLLKLKQLKMSRSEPKINKNKTILTIPKKPKPNFEDVLKNIDEVQIKMHKEKSKKVKNIIPKVVIKKNLNGSHYTSSLNKDIFNPDLTGRKWQPWVFLEKNPFIDKMAIRNETKAVFSHRNNTYVLAEKFKKYKSVSNCNAKFIITQPKSGEFSKGQLKYTIRLKHTY